MAALGEWWSVSVLLIILPGVGAPAAADSPAPPSRPECYKPCDEKKCSDNIHCTWDPVPHRQIPTDYSLHWEPKDSKNVSSLSSSGRVIHREQFPQGELRVWVEAKNQHGVATSQESVFDVTDIFKPPPPKITTKEQEPLEWHSFCGDLSFSMGTCEVRHRVAGSKAWFEIEGGFIHTYTFGSPMPGAVYEIQVRCDCSIGLVSNWSPNHRIRSAEEAPVGELDIWRDCDTFPTSKNCTLTWKVLPVSQARGVVLGYTVQLSRNDGTQTLVNVSAADPTGRLFCDGVHCHLIPSLKDVSEVSVSAFNARGATVPSILAMSTSGQEKNELAINLRMNEENISVSWDPSTLLSQNTKEYVVQYKRAGSLPGHGFDWVKVNSSQTAVFFKGQFEKYKAFQVSLFTVAQSRTIQQLSCIIGYSLQSTPARVPLFKVIAIADTQVTLSWKPLPLYTQAGVIRYYQIGLDRDKVYNVSATPQWENRTFELKHLAPGQEYEVWIGAVTEAGAGENATVRFKTKQREHYVHLLPALLAPFVLLTICTALLLSARGADNKRCAKVASFLWEKVPDPSNSQIFVHVKHQMNDPLAWICIPACEPHPKISVLEVVQIQPGTLDPSRRKTPESVGTSRPPVRDGRSRADDHDDQRANAVPEQCARTGHRDGREEYSKMLDSDEEKVMAEGNGDRCDSSEEEEFESGYEKHFMPTRSEILEI